MGRDSCGKCAPCAGDSILGAGRCVWQGRILRSHISPGLVRTENGVRDSCFLQDGLMHLVGTFAIRVCMDDRLKLPVASQSETCEWMRFKADVTLLLLMVSSIGSMV